MLNNKIVKTNNSLPRSKRPFIPNTWNGIGTIDSELKLRKTSEGDGSKSVLNFILKVKQPYKVRNKETNLQENKVKVLTFPITVWDTVAEELHAKFKKNDSVKINGYIRTFFIKTRNNKNVLSFEIICNKFASMAKSTNPEKANQFVAIKKENDRARIK